MHNTLCGMMPFLWILLLCAGRRILPILPIGAACALLAAAGGAQAWVQIAAFALSSAAAFCLRPIWKRGERRYREKRDGLR